MRLKPKRRLSDAEIASFRAAWEREMSRPRESLPRILKEHQFECARCHGVFDRGSEDEMLAEKEANGWGAMPLESMAVVCDDCYQAMTDAVPPAEWNAQQSDS